MNIKPAKTFEEQVDILVNEHGLIVGDKAAAAKALRRINYYHYRGYYIHWMDEQQKRFQPGITFDMICSLQRFDADLRTILFPYLQSIELSARAAIAYYLANTYDPIKYIDESLYEEKEYFDKFYERIKNDVEKSSEIFIRHFRNDIHYTPIWAAIEIMSFGTLAKMYRNINRQDRQNIAKEFYGLDEKVLQSYLQSLSYIRNTCAHCGRLYARWQTSSIVVRSKSEKMVRKICGDGFTVMPNMLYAFYLAMGDMLTKTEWEELTNKINSLFEQYESVVDINRIGFPLKWYEISRVIVPIN